MAHGWNTLSRSEISAVLSNPEENVGHNVDTLSSTLASHEAPSVCNLNSVQQQNYNSLQWNNEAAPSLLLDIQENLLGDKNSSIGDIGADSSSRDTKQT